MKLAEIYSHMATHDSHSKFWTCDSELTAFSSCRTSRFLLKKQPRVNASKYGCTTPILGHGARSAVRVQLYVISNSNLARNSITVRGKIN